MDRAELPARDRHRDRARQPVLRRLLRGELGQPRSLRRRHRPGADSLHREEIPAASAPAGRASCTAGRPAAGRQWRRRSLSGGLQRRLHRLPGSDRLPGLHHSCDIYKDKNAYWLDDTFKRTPRPGHRNWLGHVDSMLWEVNRLELVLGTHRGRAGPHIWEAVFSPVGRDGYPARIWDKGSAPDRQGRRQLLARELRPGATS